MLLPAPDRLAAFERDLARRTPVDHRRNLAIYEALYREAVALGALPAPDPLGRLGPLLRWAQAVNAPTAPC